MDHSDFVHLLNQLASLNTGQRWQVRQTLDGLAYTSSTAIRTFNQYQSLPVYVTHSTLGGSWYALPGILMHSDTLQQIISSTLQ